MLYRLGDNIKFEVANGPESLRTQRGLPNFVEQERLDGKPTLQRVGTKLTTIDMRIRLHHMLVNVARTLASIRTAALAGEVLTFITGSGDILGDFVIESAPEETIKTNETGVPMIVEISLSLKEFVSADPVDTEALAARKAGFANIQANPIVVNPTVTFQSPQSLVMRDIVAAQSSASNGSEKVKKASALPELAKGLLEQGARALERGRQATTAAKDKVNTVATKISNAAALEGSLQSVINSIEEMQSNFTEANLPGLRNLSLILDQNLRTLSSTAAELTNVTVLRK